MTGDGKGIRVVARKAMVLNQVVRIMQVPPNIRISHFSMRRNEYQDQNDEGQDDGERNKGPTSFPSVDGLDDSGSSETVFETSGSVSKAPSTLSNIS